MIKYKAKEFNKKVIPIQNKLNNQKISKIVKSLDNNYILRE